MKYSFVIITVLKYFPNNKSFGLSVINPSKIPENIIGASRMRNNFLVPYLNVNFSNIAIEILDFSILLCIIHILSFVQY